jgi:hypothetical protein
MPLNINVQSEYEQTTESLNTRLVVDVESKLQVRVNPYVLEDMLSLLDRFSSYYLIRDLKQYRPHRKPITDS